MSKANTNEEAYGLSDWSCSTFIVLFIMTGGGVIVIWMCCACLDAFGYLGILIGRAILGAVRGFWWIFTAAIGIVALGMRKVAL